MFPMMGNGAMQTGLMNMAQQQPPQQQQQQQNTGLMNLLRTGQWKGGEPTSLMANPIFNAGMGLMASAQDPRMSSAQGIMQGLSSARATGQEDEDRKRQEEYRQELSRLLSAQQNGTTPNRNTDQILQNLQQSLGMMTPEQQSRAQRINMLYGGR